MPKKCPEKCSKKDEGKQINLCSDKAFSRLGMKIDSIVSEGQPRHFVEFTAHCAVFTAHCAQQGHNNMLS